MRRRQLQTSLLFAEAKLSTRCFLWLRSVLTPYELIAASLPSRGRLLDLGSGHGLLCFTLALASAEREIAGVDHDVARVRLAETAALKLPPEIRPRFLVGDLKESIAALGPATLAGIAMIDILHYFDAASQHFLIGGVASFDPGGRSRCERDRRRRGYQSRHQPALRASRYGSRVHALNGTGAHIPGRA